MNFDSMNVTFLQFLQYKTPPSDALLYKYMLLESLNETEEFSVIIQKTPPLVEKLAPM